MNAALCYDESAVTVILIDSQPAAAADGMTGCLIRPLLIWMVQEGKVASESGGRAKLEGGAVPGATPGRGRDGRSAEHKENRN